MVISTFFDWTAQTHPWLKGCERALIRKLARYPSDVTSRKRKCFDWRRGSSCAIFSQLSRPRLSSSPTTAPTPPLTPPSKPRAEAVQTRSPQNLIQSKGTATGRVDDSCYVSRVCQFAVLSDLTMYCFVTYMPCIIVQYFDVTLHIANLFIHHKLSSASD